MQKQQPGYCISSHTQMAIPDAYTSTVMYTSIMRCSCHYAISAHIPYTYPSAMTESSLILTQQCNTINYNMFIPFPDVIHVILTNDDDTKRFIIDAHF